MANKKIKQRVKIDDTRYDIQLDINAIAGLNTILSSKMDKELVVGNFTAHENYLPLAVLEEDGKYYLKANTNFKLDSSKANYILTQAGTWILNNNHTHNYQSPLSNMSISEGESGTATTARSMRADYLKSIILHHSPAGSRPASDVSAWAKTPTKPSYSISEVTGLQSALDNKANSNHSHSGTYSPVVHNHDDRYYTETETNTLLSGKLGSNDNAVSASKLKTSRNISIDGGATGTATAFNGEKNIAIPITDIKESYLSFGGKSLSGNYGPIDASMVPELGANRFAFTPAGAITIQYSRDGGNTWTDYGSDNNVKINLFNGVGTNISIGKNTSSGVDYSNYQLRITLDTARGVGNIYTVLNKFVILCSTSGSSGSWCTIDARLQANYTSNVDTWTVFADKTPISGWSGYNVINTSKLTTYGNTPTTQFGQVRFTFGCTGANLGYVGLQIYKIFGFGGVGWRTPSNMAKYGRLYTYDYNQNAIFPAGITANGQSVVLNNDSRLSDSRNAKDVYAWAKASTKPNYSIGEITGLQAELDSKASALTEVQINAVNSGITSQKVSTYDGYSTSKQNKLSAGQQDAVDSGITATKVSQYDSYSSSKQDKLSAVQQSAVDSGIDSTKVSKYDGYETSKQNKLTEAQVNAVNSGITGSKVSQYDGYDSGKQDKLTTVQQNAINSGITSDKVAIYEAMVSSSHIHNNLSLLETYTQTEANLSDAVSKKHSHSNKTVLDNLTQGVINNNHTHSNKTLLETYTQTEANLSDAVSKKHSHSNKAVLDNLTQGVIDNNHIHLNKTLLDSYTQTNTDISDAVTKKHIHTNKSVLDNLTQNVIDKAHGHSSTEQIAINTISGLQGALNNKQPTLVGSGTGQNIKTIGGQNIMGSGNIPFPTSTSGTWELIRTRGPSDNLTNAGSGNTSIDIPVTTTLSEGDTIAIEVSNTSSYQQHPKIIITTLSWVDEPIDLEFSGQVGFIYHLAGNLQICSFAVTKNSTGNALITKRKQYIGGSFSGTTINWATGDYTLHIGRVWRLVQ